MVLAVAAVWTWSVTPTYASTTRIFVSTSQTDENSAYTGNLFATQRVASYADLVTSNQLAERVADELGDTDAMELREQVTASAVPETVLLEIEATDADPERARDIAQAYAEQLQIVVEELETPRGETAAVVKATLIDDAQVARSPVAPQPLRNLALAGILGLLLGVGLAVARELLDTSVKGADDVAEITCVPRPRQHLPGHRREARAARGARRRRRRGPRPSACCAPTCSTSTSTTSRRSS